MSVMVRTSLGDMVIDLFTDQCPLTCKIFLKLCKINYYDGCLDSIVQTGDPTGSGDDSIYKFLDGDEAQLFHDEIRGIIAMASAGEKNLNATQFYISDLDYLDGNHTIFGEIGEGFDSLNKINEAHVDDKAKPFQNIRIKNTDILVDPFADPFQLSYLIPDAKEEIDVDVGLEDDWGPMDEELGVREDPVTRDLPKNVLWVCNLNSVTEDEDLYTIFSRFGTVASAEIIRDRETGDSHCYGFIEFENKEACELAYFKMDNALIDDRRIHVGFSQSVAKSWNQYLTRQQAACRR